MVRDKVEFEREALTVPLHYIYLLTFEPCRLTLNFIYLFFVEKTKCLPQRYIYFTSTCIIFNTWNINNVYQKCQEDTYIGQYK